MEQSTPVDRRTPDQSAPKAAGGISQFLSRILDQLSLSAWLPAAMLVGGTALILQLHSNKNLDIARAVGDLSAKPLGILVVLVFALVLATVVTQAFEFEVIRALEGYWGTRKIPSIASGLSIHRHKRKLAALRRRRQKVRQRAFDFTRRKMLAQQLISPDKRYVLDSIEEDVYDRRNEDPDDELQQEIDMVDWRQWAPAELLRRQDSIEAAIKEFPREHRLLPTKLGNVLRSTEDGLVLSESEELEGFVLRWWQDVPAALQQEHDQYRIRLDLYCLLVFVFSCLATLGFILLDDAVHNIEGRIGVAGGFLLLAFVSYEAAIASARGFGTVLVAIADIAATDHEEAEPGDGVLVRLARRIVPHWK